MKCLIEQIRDLGEQNKLLREQNEEIKKQNEELKKRIEEQSSKNNDGQLDIMMAIADLYETTL